MIRWSKRGLDDLADISDFIADDSPKAAAAWLDRIHRRLELAAEAPLAGRIVPEFGRSDIREVFVRTYRLVYRVENSGIAIVTVFEGHRLMPEPSADDQ